MECSLNVVQLPLPIVELTEAWYRIIVLSHAGFVVIAKHSLKVVRVAI